MQNGFFWLRTVQSFCTAACAFRSDETLHSVRAQAESVLRFSADGAELYPERAGELWSDTTLDAEKTTCARWGLDEVVGEPGKDGRIADDAAAYAAQLCKRAQCRFNEKLDECVRGIRESGMPPTLLDLSVSAAAFGAEGTEPDAKSAIELAMTCGELARGMLDPAQPDEILRCNAYCVLCDKARIGTAGRTDALREGLELMTGLARSAVAGEAPGVPPILFDAFRRLHKRFLRFASDR